MVSKNNQYWKQQQEAQRVPHYGLRKLSIGVASVLLSTTLYMGVTAHADTVTTPSETTTPSTAVTTNPTTPTTTTETVSGNSASNVGDEKSNQTNEANENQAIPANADSNGKTEAQPVVATPVETETPTDKSAINNEVPKTTETTKPSTAWQSEPTTNYSADHTAKIDMTNQPTTVQGDNWKMSLDKNYIKAGQDATLTVNYEVQAGDTFVLDIGYPAGVNAQPLNSQVGTTSTKDNGLRTQVTNVFKEAGTYTQTIKLNGWKNSAEGLKLLRKVFGDQAFDLTLKRGTSVENAQDVGRLYLTSNFTPIMTGIGSVGVDRVDAKYVPVLSTNNNYIFSVRTNWSDSGTALEPSYNGDFVYSISVPKTFELDQAATEALYQQIRSNELYGNWGNRGSNVTVSQTGVGAPVIIKANALDWVAWHYSGNEGVSFLGHFVDAPSVATTLTADGQTTVSDTIGNHTQTVTLPGLSAKVINAADYNYANSGDTVFSVSDYGDHNQLYQSHEVPITGSDNPINLINDLALLNNSPFDIKNAMITLTFGDGLHVDTDSIRNNAYISNLLADNYTAPNREKSFLVTYQDGTSEMVSFDSKGNPTKNIKSVTLTRDWNASQMAGLHGGGIHGFVAKTYQDGSPVKVGDTINVSLTVVGVNTAGHNVSKTISDTLKVVDQQFAPLTTVSYWDGVHTTGLGDNPSGTVDVRWNRTSGERGKIQLENPTIYFVMPNTVSQIKNPGWGSGKDVQGNAAPTLTSITYEKSKDGKNTVAIMHFSGLLIDQVPNQYVPIIFDTVNKDNVVNQASEGYFYWTADNVNTDGLTKIDPTRADNQYKSAHLPANLSQEQLSKIYLHSPYWGTINMATGMYSTSATKTATTPWQTQTIVDYHGDGQADVGVNLVNDTSNELHNVVAIINLPKASNNSNLTVNLTSNNVELIDPNTNSKLTDGVTVLYSTKPADLSSNDLSSFVTADQIKDWSKVQAVAVTLQKLGGMTSRQVQIPVVVNDLVANAGKDGTVGTRISADELKPIIVPASAENAAKLVVGGQATIHVQMHYQDAQGKDHYVPLTNPTHAYDILQHHVLNSSDFTPSTTDLAQTPGYELSKAFPMIISGNAVIGQPVLAQDDGSVLQFELVPSTQKVLINYVDDDDNQKVIKTDTLTGKTGETQQINVVTPDNYVLVDPATNPSEYTFLASDNKPITIHLKHQRNTTPEEKTVTRKVTIVTPDGKSNVTNQTVTFTRNATVDEVTGKVTYGSWSENGKHEFATVDVPTVPGYTAMGDVPSLTVTPDSKDTNVTINYTANDQTTQVVFVDDDNNGKTVGYKDIHGKTGETQKLTNLPENYELANGQSDTITFSPNMPVETTVHLKHKIETKQLKINAYLNLFRLIKHNYNVSEDKEGNYLLWINNDELNSGEYEGHYKNIGSVIGFVQYDLVSGKVVKINNGETLKFGKTLFNYPSDDDVANGGSLTGLGDFFGHTFTQWMNEELKDNLSYKAYASANLTKTLLANKELLSHDIDNLAILVPFTFENGKQYGSDNEIDTSTIDNSSSINFDDLVKNNFRGIGMGDDGSLSTDIDLVMPIVYQPYLSKTVTRTINVTNPDKAVKTIKQTAEINQNVGYDLDSHRNSYFHKGDTYVTDNNWSAYEVPTIDGYTASQTQVEAVAVNGDTTDQTVNISYTANKQSVNVNYVDVNDGNKVVHVTTVNGVTDGDTNVPNELPNGYKLVDGQSVPKTIHFNANNNNDINVKVQHSTVTVTPDSPKTPSDKLPDNPDKSYPSGVSESDLSKTITRKVTITTPDGKSTVTKQTVTFTRNATVDEVTGHVTYGSWSENGKHTFATVDVPNVPGYTATGDVPNLTVTPDSQDTTVTISYTANKQQVHVNYVDINDDNKVVHTTTVNGVTNGDATVPNELPAGYKLVDGQSIPKTIHFNADNNDNINIKVQHATVTVTPDTSKTSSDKLPDNPDKSYPSGVSENDLNKTITRTIKVTTPDGQTKTVVQTVKLTRTATVDEVTGEVTYGKWSTGQWGAYDVPAVPGYTASQPSVEITPVNENTKDQTVDVSYTPNKQSTVVKYVDDKGQVVHTTTVNGATDQTVKVPSEVPAGWIITNGQVPSEITFSADGHEPIEVTVAHQHVTVNPDHPQDNGTKLPDNPAKTFNGVESNDLNKTITRTIKVTTPDGQNKTVEQTVHLTRTADVDEVTGEVTYGNWATGEWSNYDVPTVQGYTASQNEVPTAKVTGDTKDQTVTVTYTADQQKLIVNFIDDTTGQILKTVNKDGLTNSDSNYNTKSDIQDYVNNHYRLVSDDTNGQNLVFDNDDSKTQTYNVHLAHNTHDINDSNTVTETIHYKLDNGQKAFDDYNAQLSFTRTGYNDEVTGQNHWNDWQATNGQTFNAVQLPSKEGYTPDKTSIEAVNVKPGDKNIDTAVTYNANAQAAKISYIDDTTGRTLKVDNANGKFNQAINFDNNVDNQIKDYEQQGYVLKSNSFSNQMYQADNAKNVFEVHLVHGTKNVQRTQKITETINYQIDDGSQAPATNSQSVDFTQDGVQDLVTKDIDWEATAPQQFKEVITPAMTGYTPDIANVPATTLNFGDKDINKVITYKANAQTAKISYIDDNTGETLKTDNANGKFNQVISFGDVDGVIKGFEDKGYQLKSNSFKDQKYQADNNSNLFEVHLVHGTKNVQRTQKITETINYQMEDGSKAPVTTTQSVDFTQDGVQDLVTNNIDWKATEPQQFKAVDMPTLTGYTPDITSVPATTVNFDDKDINKTVTYKANPQSAKITYIDDNTGKTLKVDNTNGKFNQVIDFANMNSDIQDFENQGYVLKSNSFNGQKYQADNANNTFEVHFTHGTKNVQRQDTITETVKYQYDNGTPAHENNVQTLNFTQDGVQDLVTKNIDWKSTDAQEFKQVDNPTMDGYTPDITSIAATKVNFGDSDISKVVTYQANNQTANIHYVDDMNGSSIGNSTANGKFGTVIDFGNVNDKINTFKSLGYQLVSNGFNGQTYQSDNSKNVYYVHFTHGIKNVQRNKQITETIKYQYENGQQAQPDSVQTVSFNENGSQDLVTKKINWFNDAPQQFKAVSTPVITGYTADIDNIPAAVVSYDNDNINKVVTYKANSQTAKINYIDDTTGKVIKTDTANGKFNQAISFSETPTNVINGLIKRGYKLVSNSFNGQTYQSDNSKNEFTVHLAHNTKNVSKQNTVTRTINYLDNNGQAIQAPIIETVTFTQNGITDLVTGNTTWNTPSSQTFETVKSLTIKGFGKPDVEVVQPQTVNFKDQNMVVNVHYPKVTTPTNVNDNTGQKVNGNTTTPTVDHNKGKLNPTTFTTNTHQTTPQAHTANNDGQQSITPQSINKPSEQPTVANNSTKANTLPQTGNSNDNGTAIIGLGLLSGMLGLLGIKGKKKQD